MQEIKQRTLHFCEEVEAALKQKNMRHLKSELHSLLDELYHLQASIAEQGTQQQQEQLDAAAQHIIALEQDMFNHVQRIHQEHVRGQEEHFFNAFTELLQQKLDTVKRLAKK